MSDNQHTFEAYFKRAASPVIVLSVLKERPMYGYEISAAVRERSGGRYTLSVMYPILDSLMAGGYIVEHETIIVNGRARRYYAVTSAGKEYLKQVVDDFERLSDVFHALTQEDGDHEEE